MNRKRTTNGVPKAVPKTDWDRLRQMKDEDIDCSDIPPTDAKFWADAELVMPGQKVALGVRFDKDVVEWFKSQGPGYQTRMNAVLRTYMERRRGKTAAVSAEKRRL